MLPHLNPRDQQMHHVEAFSCPSGKTTVRDPERIDRVIELLRETWKLVPDWRLTQLVVNAADTKVEATVLFHLEDDSFERKLQFLLSSLRAIEPR